MTKSEQAAALRAKGKTVEEIAERFGWTISTARSLVSRGKKMDEFRQKQRNIKPKRAGR